MAALAGDGGKPFDLFHCGGGGQRLTGFAERRQRVERALHRSDEIFAKLFESASDAVLIVDEHGRIQQMNATAERMFGYSRRALIGREVEVLVPAALRKQHLNDRQSYAAAPQNRPMGSGLDLHAVRRDGTTFPVEISLSHVRDSDSLRVMAFVTDISARKAAETSVERYQEQLRQLAFESVMAEERERRRIAVDLHDRIGQSLALCQIKLGSVRQEAGEHLARELDGCIRLVSQSVDDTRSLTFELSPPVLYDLGFKSAVLWLADQMSADHGFQVRVEGGEAPPLPEELAALVFRATRELLINAIKHARTPTARVIIDSSESTLEVTVQDEGVGFDLADVSRREAAQHSFGLLSVQEQIGRVGGETHIASAPGKGTSVRLQVPVGSESTPEKVSKSDDIAGAAGR